MSARKFARSMQRNRQTNSQQAQATRPVAIARLSGRLS
jgi:hypothetical protein